MNWIRIDGCTIVFDIAPTQNIPHKCLETAVFVVYSHFNQEKCNVIRITGRGPIWLYSALVHAVAHLCKAVMVYDAVNKVWVVVVSHSNEYKIGQVVGGEPW